LKQSLAQTIGSNNGSVTNAHIRYMPSGRGDKPANSTPQADHHTKPQINDNRKVHSHMSYKNAGHLLTKSTTDMVVPITQRPVTSSMKAGKITHTFSSIGATPKQRMNSIPAMVRAKSGHTTIRNSVKRDRHTTRIHIGRSVPSPRK
jgi:hypothetical protein